MASADSDLRAALMLVKPAVLYADRVTIYSPAATMLTAVTEFAALTDPRERVVSTLRIIRQVPELAGQLDVPTETLDQMETFLALDPRIVRMLGKSQGLGAEMDTIYEKMAEVASIWENQMPETVDKVKGLLGADELLVALEARAVEVAELGETQGSEVIADALRAATGAGVSDSTEELVLAYTARIVEMLTEKRTFPLLDAQTSGLARSLELEAGLVIPAGVATRGAEVASATSFMGFLPAFDRMSMDEVLDLRRSLKGPLTRFRSVLAKISRDFEARSIDESFDAEVEEVWRTQVAPALQEIRETLAEHGLLREAASIALGDPKRLAVEAGGVIAAARSDVVALSSLWTAGLSAGLPLADIAGRALQKRREGRRGARNHAFYFLHRVGERAGR